MNDKIIQKLWEFAPAFVEMAPHSKLLGMKFVAVDKGRATLSMPYSQKFIGNPKTRVLHGGAITSLLDTVSGLAAIAGYDKPTSVATLNLSIDYMRAAEPGKTILATAHCYKVTHHVAFVRGIAHDGDEDNPVATSQATFMATAFKAGSKDYVESMMGKKS